MATLLFTALLTISGMAMVDALAASVAQQRSAQLIEDAYSSNLEKHHKHDDAADCTPREIHLSLAEEPGSMKLLWRTSAANCSPGLAYGIDVGNRAVHGESYVAKGSTYSVTEEQMCTRPARQSSFHAVMHVAVMVDLIPGQTYWYQVEGGPEYKFRAPYPAGQEVEFSFLAYGDMGESFQGHKAYMAESVVDAIVREMEREEVHLVLHVGDLAYANGKPKIWDSFMQRIEPIASTAPYMVSVGNHEVDYIGGQQFDISGEESYHPYWGNFGDDSGGECGAMAARRFAMPAGASNPAARRRTPEEAAAHALINHTAYRAADVAAKLAGHGDSSRSSSNSRKLLADTASQMADGSSSSKALERRSKATPYDNPPFWFSFDYGSVHFVTISTEHDLAQGSTQYRWLQADLEAVDRCKTPWVVLQMHRPMYVLYPHKSNRVVGDHLRDFLEDLLLDFKVDMCISGHVHAYYRTCDVRKQVCVDDVSGISHFIVGTAGHELSFIDDEQLEWGSSIVCDYGFMRFDVKGDRMQARFITSRDGKTADSTELIAQVYPREECRDFMNSQSSQSWPQ